VKTGDIKVIDERFYSGSPAASWDEFLVLEKLENGFKLDIRVYDCVGSIEDIQVEYDEDENPILPDEIDGKKVNRLVDDGIIIGWDLVQMTDNTPEIVFKTLDQEIMEGWLKMIGWNNDDVFKSLLKEYDI
jgi:hypothetical protein